MPEVFGRYRLDEEIGRGGMGEVWKASDTRYDRIVAVKLLLPRYATNEDFRKRFVRESKMVMQLDEPHVIPVYDFGEIDGRLFLAMRLVRGTDLATLLKQRPLSPTDAVAVVGQVASALDAAHAAGLVHRDVKPGNILIGRSRGEPFAYLIDFGTARAVSGSGARTITGGNMVLGTPAYMPPEQFDGVRDDRRLDVYALSCVLFEALTARRPFPFSGDPEEERRHYEHAHRHLLRPRPSVLRPDVSTAFDGVVASGMATTPADRCSSAGELADLARAALTAGRGSGQQATEPPDAAAPGTADAERVEAPDLRGIAAGSPAVTPAEVPDLPTPEPFVEWRRGSVDRPRTKVLPASRQLSSRAWYRLGAAALGVTLVVALLAAVVGAVRWWWPATIDEPPILVGAAPQAIVVDTDGWSAYVVNNGSDSVSVIDLATRTAVAPIPVGDLPTAVAVSPVGRRGYVVNSGSGSISVLDLRTRTVVGTVPVDPGPISVTVDRNGARVYVAHTGGSISVIDTATDRVIGSIDLGSWWWPTSLADLSISADGNRLLVTESRIWRDDVLREVDTRAFRPLRTIKVGEDPHGVAISEDGRRAYVANSDAGSVSVVDLTHGIVTTDVPVGEEPQDVVLSPDGRQAFVPNAGSGSFTVIDTRTNLVVGVKQPGGGPMAVSHDGGQAYVVDPASASMTTVGLD